MAVTCAVCKQSIKKGYALCKKHHLEMKRDAYLKFGMYPKVNKKVEETVKLMNETVTD